MKLKMLFLAALTLAAGQLALGQGAAATAETPRGYLIGPGDVVEGRVLGEKDFDFTAMVDEDGKIQVPFTEGIVVQCKTEKEVRGEVVKVYSKYIKNPQVSVAVKERKSRPPATVYGEVRNPQRVELTRRATLKDLIAFSGGVVAERASGMVQITRTQPLACAEAQDADWKNLSDDAVLPSRLYSLGSLNEINPEIHPGDIIDVKKAAPVYVVGEVMRSGEILMPEGGLPMMQAIAMAAGTTREARIKDVRVIRRKQGSAQPEVMIVNYEAIKKGEQKDVMLEPFDIVEIGKTKKKVWDVMLDIATGGARALAQVPAARF